MDIVERMRLFEEDHDPDGWPAVRMKQISALCDEIERLHKELSESQADTARVDWLADKDNEIGNVQLPAYCVMQNPGSLRDAIDMARRDGKNI